MVQRGLALRLILFVLGVIAVLGIITASLAVDVAPKGLFHRWLESEGKLGGQHKVPRLSNSRHYLEALLALVTPSSSEL